MNFELNRISNKTRLNRITDKNAFEAKLIAVYDLNWFCSKFWFSLKFKFFPYLDFKDLVFSENRGFSKLVGSVGDFDSLRVPSRYKKKKSNKNNLLVILTACTINLKTSTLV